MKKPEFSTIPEIIKILSSSKEGKSVIFNNNRSFIDEISPPPSFYHLKERIKTSRTMESDRKILFVPMNTGNESITGRLEDIAKEAMMIVNKNRFSFLLPYNTQLDLIYDEMKEMGERKLFERLKQTILER